ncbi:MAG: family 16 glycosylhydrolase [Paludibacteraceae bacterium]
MNYIVLAVLVLLTNCGNKNGNGTEDPKPGNPVIWQFSPENLSDFLAQGGIQSVIISSNTKWKVSSDQSWCTLSASEGFPDSFLLKVSAQKNTTNSERSAVLTFTANDSLKRITVKQATGSDNQDNYVPNGYKLVWWDEFDSPRLANGKTPLPDNTKWWYETGAGGWGNNELQNYIPGYSGTDTCAIISNGILKIIAKKKDSDVISIRMNTKESWQYGYFEARLKMPSGKGTWPAFWMLPKNFQSWPLDGEIDIMEYVGYDPNVIHATIHTQAYNHSIGTQKSAQKIVQNAETEFHVYAMEWSTEKITGYIDGVAYFTFLNDNQNNKSTWPFNVPFYLKLNLAWGGNWGGYQGIDPTILPATYEIDYIRVYQK